MTTKTANGNVKEYIKKNSFTEKFANEIKNSQVLSKKIEANFEQKRKIKSPKSKRLKSEKIREDFRKSPFKNHTIEKNELLLNCNRKSELNFVGSEVCIKPNSSLFKEWRKSQLNFLRNDGSVTNKKISEKSWSKPELNLIKSEVYENGDECADDIQKIANLSPNDICQHNELNQIKQKLLKLDNECEYSLKQKLRSKRLVTEVFQKINALAESSLKKTDTNMLQNNASQNGKEFDNYLVQNPNPNPPKNDRKTNKDDLVSNIVQKPYTDCFADDDCWGVRNHRSDGMKNDPEIKLLKKLSTKNIESKLIPVFEFSEKSKIEERNVKKDAGVFTKNDSANFKDRPVEFIQNQFTAKFAKDLKEPKLNFTNQTPNQNKFKNLELNPDIETFENCLTSPVAHLENQGNNLTNDMHVNCDFDFKVINELMQKVEEGGTPTNESIRANRASCEFSSKMINDIQTKNGEIKKPNPTENEQHKIHPKSSKNKSSLKNQKTGNIKLMQNEGFKKQISNNEIQFPKEIEKTKNDLYPIFENETQIIKNTKKQKSEKRKKSNKKTLENEKIRKKKVKNFEELKIETIENQFLENKSSKNAIFNSTNELTNNQPFKILEDKFGQESSQQSLKNFNNSTQTSKLHQSTNPMKFEPKMTVRDLINLHLKLDKDTQIKITNEFQPFQHSKLKNNDQKSTSKLISNSNSGSTICFYPKFDKTFNPKAITPFLQPFDSEFGFKNKQSGDNKMINDVSTKIDTNKLRKAKNTKESNSKFTFNVDFKKKSLLGGEFKIINSLNTEDEVQMRISDLGKVTENAYKNENSKKRELKFIQEKFNKSDNGKNQIILEIKTNLETINEEDKKQENDNRMKLIEKQNNNEIESHQIESVKNTILENGNSELITENQTKSKAENVKIENEKNSETVKVAKINAIETKSKHNKIRFHSNYQTQEKNTIQATEMIQFPSKPAQNLIEIEHQKNSNYTSINRFLINNEYSQQKNAIQNSEKKPTPILKHKLVPKKPKFKKDDLNKVTAKPFSTKNKNWITCNARLSCGDSNHKKTDNKISKPNKMPVSTRMSCCFEEGTYDKNNSYLMQNEKLKMSKEIDYKKNQKQKESEKKLLTPTYFSKIDLILSKNNIYRKVCNIEQTHNDFYQQFRKSYHAYNDDSKSKNNSNREEESDNLKDRNDDRESDAKKSMLSEQGSISNSGNFMSFQKKKRELLSAKNSHLSQTKHLKVHFNAFIRRLGKFRNKFDNK